MIERPRPFYEQAYHAIKRMIFEGKLKPGEQIAEAKLANELGVSKGPLREAIRVLEKEGLMIVNPRLMVYKPTIKDVEEIYFCRIALESSAAGEIANTASGEELKLIEDILKNTEVALKALDHSKVISLNEKFHELIVQLTHNNKLYKMISDLNNVIHFYRVLSYEGKTRAENILKQHQQVFHFIKEGDEEQASKAMAKHLRSDLEHLINIMNKNNFS
ncbi:GntR family transcriptional regulator [Bacillus spizizenii]|uniref:GntR family transcriptional regulator n=1 Tax=Bacillus halotolerans TaxID=260554 RepID=UPI0022805657|nr:GntR family transcriptional regulator [Bacillus halotolerans]MCY8413414.1 GntR family transcriptional regulator [Bacillus spizizenii]MCY8428167.1 GntR family transcriptional regulator [Bacillus spizizenii]MCY8443406.1 GntR family transcriptional regulator [Bacillus spizizenii]MCY8448176.1 GntR family transcriptional regulator [Bacillus spizizenii]MCY8675632.1 GntR family transcriptional regulator [Bacillus spizizenii]